MTHFYQCHALFNPNDLVGIWMNFQSDIGTDRNAHQGHLRIVASPNGGTKIRFFVNNNAIISCFLADNRIKSVISDEG